MWRGKTLLGSLVVERLRTVDGEIIFTSSSLRLGTSSLQYTLYFDWVGRGVGGRGGEWGGWGCGGGVRRSTEGMGVACVTFLCAARGGSPRFLTGMGDCLTGMGDCLTGMGGCLTGMGGCLTGMGGCLAGMVGCSTKLNNFLYFERIIIFIRRFSFPLPPSSWHGLLIIECFLIIRTC